MQLFATSLNRNTEILAAGWSNSQSSRYEPGLKGGSKPAVEFNLADMDEWDVEKTVAFLHARGLHSCANHFQEEELTGSMMVQMVAQDIMDMPEKSSVKQRAFSTLVAKCKAASGK